jgi:prephenate dehydrogenase
MPKTVTVIGCGLIGGSICLALKRNRRDWRIIGLDLPDRLPAIIEACVCDEVHPAEDAPQCASASDLVILATPVQILLTQLERIAPHLQPGTVVTDVGSTKMRIMERARDVLPRGVFFVGGHPVAGSEKTGVEAADPLLFSERIFAICPNPDTPPEALLQVIDLVEDLLALPVTIEPEEHDRIMATVSHVPQLVAIALMHAALEEDATHGLLEMIAGRGFLDLTRVAASEFEVWSGILETNKASIQKSLSRFEKSLAELREAMESNKMALLWERVSRRRRRMGLDSQPRMRKVDLRGLIDSYDKQLMGAVANRMQLARKMGTLKQHQELAVRDPEREQRLLAQRREWGKALDLPPELIRELFAVILKHSVQAQRTRNP